MNGRDSGPAIQAIPDRLDSLRWILIGGLAALFALGLVIVWRQPVALAGEAASIPAALPTKSARALRKQEAREASRPAAQRAVSAAVEVAPQPAPPVATASLAPDASPERAATTVAAVEQEVEQSLDGLKDRLFRLELRRQAGTISDEDYLRERNRTEQVLRELVRG